MVSTLDGKIITGERNESVHDLGSKTDKVLMKRIEAAADAVLLGAETLRAAQRSWNPNSDTRIVVSKSGNVPFDSGYLSNGTPIVVVPKSATVDYPPPIQKLSFGEDYVDFDALLCSLFEGGTRNLLVLGGSEINAQFFRAGLVDEIFLTLAPKIKLGRDVPTIADGEPLARAEIQKFGLIETHQVEDELFLRYRRRPSS
ncbi:RibD Pyrimidine reductase, riboflavin biosynthesis [Fimbriimonadaceae bacterium]